MNSYYEDFTSDIKLSLAGCSPAEPTPVSLDTTKMKTNIEQCDCQQKKHLHKCPLELIVLKIAPQMSITSKKLEQVESGGGKNFPQLHTHIMRFKSWLRGVHHHCSENHIQGYLDEFHFRFNRRGFLNSIFDKLIGRMVTAPPIFISQRGLNE